MPQAVRASGTGEVACSGAQMKSCSEARYILANLMSTLSSGSLALLVGAALSAAAALAHLLCIFVGAPAYR